jgi:uncharacterized damage-inducible protein DinB
MLDSYRELLDIVVQGPTQLKAAAEAAGEPPVGEWSAAQVLAHMAATEQIWLERLNQMLREKEPRLRPGGSGKGAEIQEQLMTGTVDDNLNAFNTTRGEIVSLLMGLSLRDWERTGIHDTRGELSIADVVEDIVDHDADHVAQLVSLSASQ